MMWARRSGRLRARHDRAGTRMGPLGVQQPAGAAQVLVNARVWTGDSARSCAEAVAVVGGWWVHPEEPLSP